MMDLKRIWPWLLAAVLAVTLVVVWVTTPDAGTADPANPKQVALGERVYQEQCAACHGEKLEGQPNWREWDEDGYLPAPPHDASGHTWHHDDQLLFKITKLGTRTIAGDDYKTRMEGFGEILTDDEIWAALAFIKSRWPAEVLARQERRNQRAKQ